MKVIVAGKVYSSKDHTIVIALTYREKCIINAMHPDQMHLIGGPNFMAEDEIRELLDYPGAPPLPKKPTFFGKKLPTKEQP